MAIITTNNKFSLISTTDTLVDTLKYLHGLLVESFEEI